MPHTEGPPFACLPGSPRGCRPRSPPLVASIHTRHRALSSSDGDRICRVGGVAFLGSAVSTMGRWAGDEVGFGELGQHNPRLGSERGSRPPHQHPERS